ncbi:MAG: hypothetical protein II225_03955 [Ruminococcus sp.]|nr:hypothetical protein [Ruminococcus sp.]
MNKEDVLQNNCEEDLGSDERETKLKLQSYSISTNIGALICLIYIILEEWVFDRDATIAWGIYTGMMFTKSLFDAIKLKKKSDIALAIIWGLCFTAHAVIYIMSNIG